MNEECNGSKVENYLNDEDFIALLTHYILAQYGINNGLKMFGKWISPFVF